MIPRCANCGYDLTGLRSQICPECGTVADDVSLLKGWDQKVSRRWTWFLLSPLLALPGLIAVGIGHPIATTILGTVLAYRAFELEDRVKGKSTGPFMRVVQSGLLAVTWAAASCIILWIAIFALAALVLGY